MKSRSDFLVYAFLTLCFAFTSEIVVPVISFGQGLNASFTIQDATLCENSLACFIDNTTGGVVPYTYNWNFSGQGTSVIKNPCWTFVGTGNFTVVLTVTDAAGSSDQATGTVRVFNNPTASFSVDDPQGCRNHTVCFTDNSIPGDAPLDQWSWSPGLGMYSTQQNPCFTYNLPGTYNIFFTVIDTNGCFDKDTLYSAATVYDNPKANFTTQPTSVACNVPGTFNFTDASLQADTNGVPIVSWVWTFGDGSPAGSGSSTSHTYNATGPYVVKLVIADQNGCKDSISKTVYVDNFDIFINTTAPADTAGCVPHTVAFMGSYYSVLGATGKPGIYLWSFPGGIPGNAGTTTSPTPAITYGTPGTYNVMVTATNGFTCTGTDTITITVFPIPAINFTADTTVSCQAPFIVTFTDYTPDAADWIWDFDNWNPVTGSYDWSNDGSGQSVQHSYQDTGCFNISVIVTDTNGCIDSLVKDNFICVREPIADFEFDTNRGCVPLMVGFTDKSVVPTLLPNNDIVTWRWEFGDGNIIEGGDINMPDSTNNCRTACTFRNPTHSFTDTGMFDVTLIVTTALGCKDTIFSAQTVQCITDGKCNIGAGIPPVAEFSSSGNAGCFPYEVEFSDLSSSYANTWFWDFGDGGFSSGNNPVYTYQNLPGVFTVALMASMYGCASTVEKNDWITVSGTKADFFPVESFALCYGDSQLSGKWEVVFADSSTNADYWIWNFGDSLSATFKTVDTFFTSQQNSSFITADTLLHPDSVFAFSAPHQSSNPPCSYNYQISVAQETLFVAADTLPGQSDTVFATGDVAFYTGTNPYTVTIQGDTAFVPIEILFTPSDTIIELSYKLITTGDTIIYPAQTLNFGCDIQLVIPPETTITAADTMLTFFAYDTACLPYDLLAAYTDTSITPCFFTIAIPDTATIPADNIVVPGSIDIFLWDMGGVILTASGNINAFPDTIVISVPDSVCLIADSATYANNKIFAINFSRSDSYFVSTTTTPPTIVNNSFPADTLLPDILWHNCTYVLTDTVFPEVKYDTIPADTQYHPGKVSHSFSEPGKYQVTLVTRDDQTGCIDSSVKTISICRIQPDFLVLPNDSACEPMTVQMQDATQSICDVTEWLWDFDDGCMVYYNQQFANSTDPIDPIFTIGCGNSISGTYENPVKNYPQGGEYTVTLIKADAYGCTDSVQKQIVVHDNPLSGFEGDTLMGCSGLEVHFCDTSYYSASNNIVKWVWTCTNVTANPNITVTHTTYLPCDTFVFTVASNTGPLNYFNVVLQVFDEFGCTYTVTHPQYINVTNPTASMVFDNTWCSGMPLNLASNSSVTGPATYTWDFCDGTVQTTSATTVSHTFNAAVSDTFDITLLVSDNYGCIDDTTMKIFINNLVADFDTSYASTQICPPVQACFSDMSTSSDIIISWMWDFGIGYPSSAVQNPCNYYFEGGSFDVQLIITTSQGCKDTIIKNDIISISAPKLISVSAVDTDYCNTCPMQLTYDITVFNTKWIVINYGDGYSDSLILNTTDTTEITFEHCFSNAGTFDPNIYLWDPLHSPPQSFFPCGFSWLQPVTVSGPLLDFSGTETTGLPRQVNFTNLSTGYSDVDIWEWNFGDPASGAANTSNDFSPSHYYFSYGSYDVTMKGYVIYELIGDTCIYAMKKSNFILVSAIDEPGYLPAISVFPNPANQYIRISLAPVIKEGDIIITDPFGRQVANHPITVEKTEYNFNLHELSKGIYFIRVTGGERTGKTLKIVLY